MSSDRANPIRIREATSTDRTFLHDVVPRLRAFGPTGLRPLEALDGAERDALRKALDEPDADEILLVAELDDRAEGVAYASTKTDYFTGERHGHLEILAVSETAEGRGVGRALLVAIEDWSRQSGHRFLTLNVFWGNTRARSVYERAGFEPDTIRYAKLLTS